jgi:hypothetical protein
VKNILIIRDNLENWQQTESTLLHYTGYLDVAGFRYFINCILLFIIKSLLCVFVII